jgi:subtilase family serine protease
MKHPHKPWLALVAVLAVGGAVAALAATAHAAGNGDVKYVANPPSIKGPTVGSLAGKQLPGFGNNCTAIFGTPFPLACYDPTQIRNAYDVPSDLTGAGQTIVIVDAYGDPTIEDDLATFDAFFGVPDPPSFTIHHGSNTQKAGPHDAAGWALETALDVEWAHAIAPGAAIVLAEAPSSSGNAINSTEKNVVSRYPGAIVSQSFGIEENAIRGNGNNIQWKQADENFQAFAAQGDTVLASAGDEGASSGTSSNTPSFPSSDPWVTAVGGTQGLPYPFGLCIGPSATSDDCSYVGEQVWNEPDIASVPLATGGAPSQLFAAPSYQAGLTGFDVRTTPDVAYDAAINGGVLVVQLPNIYLVGGTSCGSPQWAGIFALVNEARANAGKGPIGFANPALYAIYQGPRYSVDFHDITAGNNTLAGAPVQGYSAGTGYDLATGIGTPDVANLITDLSG